MARIRSPNYPALSLSEAINRVKTIHDAEQHLAAPKDVIARHLGYNGLNGLSLKLISALLKYGLLEEANGDRLKVSESALSILYPQSPEAKAKAIKEAASKPALFAEIATEWGGASPSDANLRAYLIRRNFSSDAVDRVIKSYRDTIALVTQESGGYAAPSDPQSEPEKMEQTSHGATRTQRPEYSTVFHRPSGEEPFRVSFTGNGIEVTGRLTTPESADEFVRAINALKLLLRPVGSIKRPTEQEEPESAE